jgi:hypothetical protein
MDPRIHKQLARIQETQVVDLDAIEHVENDASVLRELQRVCRPGSNFDRTKTGPRNAFLAGILSPETSTRAADVSIRVSLVCVASRE